MTRSCVINIKVIRYSFFVARAWEYQHKLVSLAKFVCLRLLTAGKSVVDYMEKKVIFNHAVLLSVAGRDELDDDLSLFKIIRFRA